MKMRLAVPTNSVSASARPFLDRHRLTRFFEVSVTGDEIERGKPHPDIYLCAVERRGVPPDACLVIEDALPGIAAKAAKMHVAAIPDRPRAREGSGLYLLGSPSEMAAFNQQLHLAGD